MGGRWNSAPFSRGSFSSYWRATKPLLHTPALSMPTIVSATTAFYFLAKLRLIEWTVANFCGYIGLSLVLCLLPFLHSVTYKNRLAALTAIILQICVISLESILGRKQCLVTYLVFMLFFRIMYYRTVFDNFALCLAFSSNVGATTRGETTWYYNSNLLIWSYFFLALFLHHVYKRISARIWQHARLLLILNERIKREKRRCDDLIAARFPPHIVEAIHSLNANDFLHEPSGRNLDDSSPPTNKGRRVTQRLAPNNPDKAPSHHVPMTSSLSFPLPAKTENTDPFLEAAWQCDLVQRFEEGPTTAEMLANLDHSDRRNTAVIAIRVDGSSSECALDHKVRNIVFTILDQAAEGYSITPIRRFGSTWIGCVGFFYRYDSDVGNCYAALQYTCYILTQLKKYDIQLAIALDYGNILGGFVNSPDFELYGQEMHWVLQMTDLQHWGRIILGDGARHHLTQARRLLTTQTAGVTTTMTTATMGMGTSLGPGITVASSGGILGGTAAGFVLPTSLSTSNPPDRLNVTVDKLNCSVPWMLGATCTIACVTHPQDFVRQELIDNPLLSSLYTLLTQCFDVELLEIFPESISLDGLPPAHANVLRRLLHSDRQFGWNVDLLRPRPDYVHLLHRWNTGQTELQRQYRSLSLTSALLSSATTTATAAAATATSPSSSPPHDLAGGGGGGGGGMRRHNMKGTWTDVDADSRESRPFISPLEPILEQFRDAWRSKWDPSYWMEDLGIEFRTSLAERYGVDIEAIEEEGLFSSRQGDARQDDSEETRKGHKSELTPLLPSSYSSSPAEDDLIHRHEAMEQAIFEVMRQVFFTSIWTWLHVVDRTSQFTDIETQEMDQSIRTKAHDPTRIIGQPPWHLFVSIPLWEWFRDQKELRERPLHTIWQWTKEAVGRLWKRRHSAARGKGEGNGQVEGQGQEGEGEGVERREESHVLSSLRLSDCSNATLFEAEGGEHSGRERVKPSSSRREHRRTAYSVQSAAPSSSSSPPPPTSPSPYTPLPQSSHRRQSGCEASPSSSERLREGQGQESRDRLQEASSSPSHSVASSSSPPTLFGHPEERKPSLPASPHLQRTWTKYATDSRLFAHHALLHGAICFVYVGLSAVPLRNYLASPNSSERDVFIGFIQLYLLHILLTLTLERVLGSWGSYITIILRVCIFLVLPSRLLFGLFFSPIDRRGGDDERVYGDFGGDVAFLLFCLIRLPSSMYQSAMLSLLDGTLCRLVLLARQLYYQHPVLPQAHLSSILVLLALDFVYWMVQHRSLLSFLLEHHLVPFAWEQYRRQVLHTRKILHVLYPDAADRFQSDLFPAHFYRQAALAIVHIKPADKLAAFLSPPDFCNLMHRVHDLIDEAFVDCGLLPVTYFGGVHLAAVCKEAAWDRIRGLRVPVTHTARVVLFLRVLRNRLDRFCKGYNINLPVAMGITTGPACLGLIGGSSYTFDLEGVDRDHAICMTCYHPEAIYVSRSLEEEVAKVFPREDLLHRQRVREDWKEGYWLQMDSSFHGISLHDFTYAGLLGKGGYGAVHLLCEKYTNKYYAIKAMPLKENAVMSRMMQRECVILQRMNHPNVVSLQYTFMANNQLYLVLTYLSCGNLKQVIDRDNPPPSVLRLWFAELCAAISYVHSVGVIHRDIKPANCMIDNKGHLKLTDFGLSKIIRSSPSQGGSGGGELAEDLSASSPPPLTSSASDRRLLGLNETVHAQLQKYLPLKASYGPPSAAAPSTPTTTPMTSSVEAVAFPLLLLSDRPLCPTLSVSSSSPFTRLALPGASASSSAVVECCEKRLPNSGERLHFSRVLSLSAAINELKKRNIEALLVDGRTVSGPELLEAVHSLCRNVRNHVPIYAMHIPDHRALELLRRGAKQCFETGLEDLDEGTWRRLLSLQTDSRAGGSNNNSSTTTTAATTTATSAVTTAATSTSNSAEAGPVLGTNSGPGGRSQAAGQNTLEEVEEEEGVRTMPTVGTMTSATTTAGGSTAAPLSNAAAAPTATTTAAPTASSPPPAPLPPPSASAAGHSLVGTLHYLAPEVVLQQAYAEAVDWWAYGITLYVCLMRQHVFQGEDAADLRHKIVSTNADVSALRAKDEDAFELVSRLLDKDPTRRLGSQGGGLAVSEQPYFRGTPWGFLSSMDMPFQPAEFKVGKYDLREKLLFYGEPDLREKLYLSMRAYEAHSVSVVERYKESVNRGRWKGKKGARQASGASGMGMVSGSQGVSGGISGGVSGRGARLRQGSQVLYSQAMKRVGLRQMEQSRFQRLGGKSSLREKLAAEEGGGERGEMGEGLSGGSGGGGVSGDGLGGRDAIREMSLGSSLCTEPLLEEDERDDDDEPPQDKDDGRLVDIEEVGEAEGAREAARPAPREERREAAGRDEEVEEDPRDDNVDNLVQVFPSSLSNSLRSDSL